MSNTFTMNGIQMKDLIYTEQMLEIGVEIISLPEDLLLLVQKSVEKEKADIERWLHLKNHKWCDQPGVIDFHTLAITFTNGQPMKYRILTTFHDAEDIDFEGTAETAIDLSEHDAEFKRIISDFLFNNFFK